MKLAHITAAIIGVTVAGCASASQPAQAGSWKFHPARCPDLVEDFRDRAESRRDERYTRGPLDKLEDIHDRRESRRDESVTYCPRRAWSWQGNPRYKTRHPGPVKVYWDPYKRHYYRYGPNKVRVTIVL